MPFHFPFKRRKIKSYRVKVGDKVVSHPVSEATAHEIAKRLRQRFPGKVVKVVSG